MKLTIEVEDKEEFIGSLNSAVYALRDLECDVLLGLGVPVAFEKMLVEKAGPDRHDQYEFIKKRADLLMNVYCQLLDEKGD